MWTFENPPLAYLEEEYGFKPDQEWLNSLRLGSLRVGGEDVLSSFGSASFVSPQGLIMTSSRCLRDAVATTRPRELNMINAGFVAEALEDEFRLRTGHNEWLTAAQLGKITNVTDKVNKGVAASANTLGLYSLSMSGDRVLHGFGLELWWRANGDSGARHVVLEHEVVVQ